MTNLLGIYTTKGKSSYVIHSVLVFFIVFIVFGAAIFDTKIISIQSATDTAKQNFSVTKYAQSKFIFIRNNILSRAVEAQIFYQAIVTNKLQAIQKYGKKPKGGIGVIIPITFTGTVGKGKLGVFNIRVTGLPDTQIIRLQTGPAINGTDLRDATGTIKFNQFKNQIEYQNVGAALNKEMKKQVLSAIDNQNFAGKKITVTGVFRLINPKNWLITPVQVELQ